MCMQLHCSCQPREVTVLIAGQLVACDSPAGRLGLTVCYDLRFPEVYQQLAFNMGAQILLVPSAFTKLTGVQQSCCRAELAQLCEGFPCRLRGSATSPRRPLLWQVAAAGLLQAYRYTYIQYRHVKYHKVIAE